MDKSGLYGLMKANGFDTEQLMAHYSFSGSSGMLMFNEEQEVSGANWMSGHFLDWPETGKVDYSLNPGLSIGKSDLHLSTVGNDGSGYFTGDSVLRLGSGIGSSEWTAFLSFSGDYIEERKNLGRVILSTAASPDATSGFFIGENSRSLFVENYNTGESAGDAHVFKKASLRKNLISLSKNEYGRISLALHDFSDLETINSQDFALDGYSDSDQIYIGGFPSSLNSSYTGFSGYIDDFVLLSGSIGEIEKADIARAFVASNYQPSQYIETSSEEVAISGMSLETGVIDTGVTGYENAIIETVTNLAGESVSTYISSGKVGEITGEFFSGVTGSGVTTVLSTSFTEERALYDSSAVASYAPDSIVFNNSLSAADIFEIYSQKNRSDSISVDASHNAFDGKFFVSLDLTGIEQNSEVGLVYANGKLLESGDTNTGMFVRGTDYSIRASGYSGSDFVLVDRIPDYSGGQVYYETSSATGLSFTSDKYLEKDIYHEGVKLLSGKQWAGQDSYVEITQTSYAGGTIGEGTLNFVPVVRNKFERATGLGPTGKVQPGFKMLNEQVWVNGIRQRKDRDYYSLSSRSQLVSDSRQPVSNHLLYSGENRNYNV